MGIRTIIIDDDAIWRDLTSEFVKMTTLLELVGTFDSAIAAYPFLMKEKVDLILLDVEMPQLDGLKFAKSLSHPPMIVFITSHSESAVEGFEVAATDFLIKPYSIERFFKMVERVQQQKIAQELKQLPPQYDSLSDDIFFVRSNNAFIKINYNDVLYIKAMENFIQIVTPLQKHTALIPLSTVENQLPKERFFRTHRSYIVNSHNIGTLNKDSITIGEHTIPLSDQYRENIVKTIIESKLLKK